MCPPLIHLHPCCLHRGHSDQPATNIHRPVRSHAMFEASRECAPQGRGHRGGFGMSILTIFGAWHFRAFSRTGQCNALHAQMLRCLRMQHSRPPSPLQSGAAPDPPSWDCRSMMSPCSPPMTVGSSSAMPQTALNRRSEGKPPHTRHVKLKLIHTKTEGKPHSIEPEPICVLDLSDAPKCHPAEPTPRLQVQCGGQTGRARRQSPTPVDGQMPADWHFNCLTDSGLRFMGRG